MRVSVVIRKPEKVHRRRRFLSSAVAEALEKRELLSTYPASVMDAPPVAVSGFNYNFTVTYSSALKVRRSTLDSHDITVTGPNGYSQNARLLSVDKSSDATTLVASYRIQAPDGMWDYPDSGNYVFTLNSAQVRDAANNPVRQKTLKRMTLNLPVALTYPFTSVSATPIDRWGGTYLFKVTYSSSLGIRTSTVDNRDMTIIGPDGYSQTARFYSMQIVNPRTVVARYKITAPDGYWNNTANGTYTYSINAGQVRDLSNNPTRQRVVGTMTVGIPKFPTDVGQVRPLPQLAVDVTNFGAFPNDGIDDTTAIQAAIDSLPKAQGVPNNIVPIGGIVTLPAGTFTLSQPLRMTSCAWLRGVGSQTVLNNVSTDPNSAAIFLYSAFGHGYCVNPQVQNLKIQTAAAKGIQVDPNLFGDLLDPRVDGVTISSGGTAIDFSNVDVYQTTINNVTVTNPGGAALWIKVSRRNSALNRITGLTVTGTARAGFNSSLPLITIGGDVSVADLDIRDIGTRVVPLSLTAAGGQFSNTVIETLAGNLTNGQVMRVDSSFVRFDTFDGISSTRRLGLVNSRETHFEDLGIASGSTLANSVNVDSSSHLTVEHAHGGVGSFPPARVIVRSIATGGMTPSGPVKTTSELAPASSLVVNVTKFGAHGDDLADDTAAIQAAIDSLPKGNGIPGSSGNVGGTVMFPGGRFFTSATLRVPSGVWLVGQGFGTLIANSSADASSSLIQFVSGAAAGFNVGAGVVNLALHADNAAGITADSALTGGLVDPRLMNLSISTAGVGVDLRNVKTYHARFESIFVRDPGSAAMWLGDAAGYSADNEVIGLQDLGTIRSGYRTDGAQVVLTGQTTLESCLLELSTSIDLPLKASGDVTLRGLWAEYAPTALPNGIVASFENVYRTDIDRLILIDNAHKLRFRNATGVSIGNLDIAGVINTLDACLDLDNTSRLSIDTVNAIFDAGMLDDPRTKIGGVYNQTAVTYTDTNLALTGSNLVIDPNFTDVGTTGNNKWYIAMGDGLGVVQGSWAVEQTANGPRIRVTITGNPNNRPVQIEPKLSIPSAQIGKSLMARWRIDGPPGAIMWGERFEYQYSGRVANSLTANISPRPLLADTEFSILLPPTLGTYYISEVGVVVNG